MLVKLLTHLPPLLIFMLYVGLDLHDLNHLRSKSLMLIHDLVNSLRSSGVSLVISSRTRVLNYLFRFSRPTILLLPIHQCVSFVRRLQVLTPRESIRVLLPCYKMQNSTSGMYRTRSWSIPWLIVFLVQGACAARWLRTLFQSYHLLAPLLLAVLFLSISWTIYWNIVHI